MIRDILSRDLWSTTEHTRPLQLRPSGRRRLGPRAHAPIEVLLIWCTTPTRRAAQARASCCLDGFVSIGRLPCLHFQHLEYIQYTTARARGGSTRPPCWLLRSEGDAHPADDDGARATCRAPRTQGRVSSPRTHACCVPAPKSPAIEFGCPISPPRVRQVRASELGNDKLRTITKAGPDGLERHDHESFSSSIWR